MDFLLSLFSVLLSAAKRWENILKLLHVTPFMAFSVTDLGLREPVWERWGW